MNKIAESSAKKWISKSGGGGISFIRKVCSVLYNENCFFFFFGGGGGGQKSPKKAVLG